MASIQQAGIAKNIYGMQPTSLPFPEVANLNQPPGVFVKRVATPAGFIDVIGVDDADLLGMLIEKSKNSSAGGGSGAPSSLVIPFTEANLVAMSIGGTDSIASADLGARYGITTSGTGDNVKYVVDKTDTVNIRVKIVEFLDPVGEVNGRVLCSVLPANRQFTRDTV